MQALRLLEKNDAKSGRSEALPQFLMELPAGPKEYRLAWVVALLSAAVFLFIAPFAKAPLAQVWAFIPIYESALAINNLITAVLLLGQFRTLRSRALLVLANGYLFAAAITVVHALTFPGLFSPGGLLNAGPQSAAWIYILWHGCFPLFVIGYALFKHPPHRDAPLPGPARGAVLKGVVAVLALVGACVLLVTAGQALLPEIMVDHRYTSSMFAVVLGVWGVSFLALFVLWKRRSRSVLDLWLMIVMCAWIFDIALSALFNGGRFDLGFYAGRIYGLFASGFVLLVLLLENSVFYTRLVEAHARELKKNRALQHLGSQLETHAAELTATLSALHQKEEEIHAVMDNLLECIITIDTRGIVRSTNPALESVLGYRAEEVVGRNVSMLMPEPHRSRHDGYLARHVRTGEARIVGSRSELEGRHKDGRLIPIELSITKYTVRDETLFVGALRDISERRQFIADLTQAQADAEQASRAKSAFLATMSHEIRTPMNGVIGMVDVLAHSPLSEHQTGLVNTVRQSASTLLGLIDDILDFSKIEAGRLQIDEMPVSIADLVEGLCNSLVSVATEKNVDIALFVSPDIPERVLSDDIRLRQVLYNLVGNAIKFSGLQPGRRGHVSVRVEIIRRAPLELSFRVADNGIGIAPEVLKTLFTPFTQAEISTTRRFGGTGLGLAICRRLIGLMRGEIAVTSTPGSGSVFTVTLPFALAVEQPPRVLPDVAGLNCVIVTSGLALNSDDIRAYLSHGGAHVYPVADLEAGARATASLDAPVVVIHGAEPEPPTPWPGVRAPFPAAPGVHHLLIHHGRPPRVNTGELIALNGSALRRQVLLSAVAATAGRVSLDLFQTHTAKRPQTGTTNAPAIAEARAVGQLILVVEDDEINQKVFLQQLKLLGYAAEIAINGVEALQMWRAGNYGLMMTDLHMPEMDGYTLTETIRREEGEHERLPILLITANALRKEASRAHAAGVDAYLTKPVQLEQLRAALEKWLPGACEMPALEVAPKTRQGTLPAVVDIEVLKGMVGDDTEVVREFLSDFLLSARRLSAELRVSHAGDDLRQMGAIAHKLKSSSRSVGALALGDLCAGLENAGKAGDRQSTARDMPRFESALVMVDAYIVDFLTPTF